MDLDDILSKYPMISLAKISDDQKLSDFFTSSPMSSSSLDLSYQRSPNFFTFLNYQGDKSFVFCAHNDAGELIGVASTTVRVGYVEGKKVNIGYLSDLRVDRKKSTKEFSVQWKACMGDLIENFQNITEIKTDYLITAILANNAKAKRALVNRDENSFHYECISEYKMVNILKKLTTFTSNKYQVQWFSGDKTELMAYLDKANQERAFGFTGEFIASAVDNWSGASWDKFLIVREKGVIIAATLVWSPSKVKKIIINKLPISLKILNKFLSLITYAPKVGSELKVEYLNFLNIDIGHEKALNSMVNFLTHTGHLNRFHAVSYADFDKRSYKTFLSGAISTSTPLQLYQVVAKNDMGSIVKLNDNPGFEIALV